MYDRTINVLLVESDINDARLIHQLLSIESNIEFKMDLAENLSAGLEFLGKKPYDIILLNIFLPENQGLDTLERFHDTVPEIPIIIMTSVDDESLGIKSVQNGAQDYLVKEAISRNLLVKSISYAIERSHLQMELMAMAHIDELTKLYNRRGFLAMARQQQKIATRTHRGTQLYFIDLDKMKEINDNFGHKEGDLALIETAKILKKTFRESDIVARLGGDEFVVLAIEINEDFSDTIIRRIHENVAEFNASSSSLFNLSLSIGVAHIPPDSTATIEELLVKADSSMYENKRKKKQKEL
ncbi:MAG: GGDEF domain-containing response regulator [Clostridia bacterium]|nr:GGDEF domain-containing response regulator [Clostridia bacterium]